MFLTSAEFGYGVDAFTIPPLASPGTYTVHLAATDLAGNFNRIVGSLTVRLRRHARPPRPKALARLVPAQRRATPRRSRTPTRDTRLGRRMTPRTILYTGKGGVGKTSVAACTARASRRPVAGRS